MFKDFKPIFFILVRFILIYVFLLILYQSYLNYFSGMGLDPYSRIITDIVSYIQNILNYSTQLYDDVKGEQIYYFVNNDYRTRMVEGCNAISVMILFLSFIFAFYKGVNTFVFAFLSILFLYIINVMRIVGLNIINTDYKEYSKIAHDIIFPAVIYGAVIILWIVWMKMFALRSTNK